MEAIPILNKGHFLWYQDTSYPTLSHRLLHLCGDYCSYRAPLGIREGEILQDVVNIPPASCLPSIISELPPQPECKLGRVCSKTVYLTALPIPHSAFTLVPGFQFSLHSLCEKLSGYKSNSTRERNKHHMCYVWS